MVNAVVVKNNVVVVCDDPVGREVDGWDGVGVVVVVPDDKGCLSVVVVHAQIDEALDDGVAGAVEGVVVQFRYSLHGTSLWLCVALCVYVIQCTR